MCQFEVVVSLWDRLDLCKLLVSFLIKLCENLFIALQSAWEGPSSTVAVVIRDGCCRGSSRSKRLGQSRTQANNAKLKRFVGFGGCNVCVEDARNIMVRSGCQGTHA